MTPGRWSGGLDRLERDGVAELGQASDVVAGVLLRSAPVEVVGTEILEEDAAAEDVVDHRQDAVGHRDRGALRAAAPRDPAELGPEVAALDLDRRPGRLEQ